MGSHWGPVRGLFESRGFCGDRHGPQVFADGLYAGRRYANHRGGKKYDGPVPDDKKGQSGAHGRAELPRSPEDPEKAAAAAIFKRKWDEAKAQPDYVQQMADFKARYGK